MRIWWGRFGHNTRWLVNTKRELLWLGISPVCLPSVCLMSLHMTKSPRPSLSIFTYWERSNTWGGNTAKKDLLFWQLYFSTELHATVDMVYGMILEYNPLWQPPMGNTVHIELLQEQLNASRAGSLLRRKISAICNKRALFPYNNSCHVNYSAHKVSVP